MSSSSLLARARARARSLRVNRAHSPSRSPVKLRLETLEDRVVPAFNNTLVNNPTTDLTAQDTQSETSTLTFGSTVLVAYNDSGAFVNGTSNHFTGWSRSTDGGLTFTDLGTLPGNDDFGDPSLARINNTGTVLLATLNGSGAQINVFRSTNGGATFNAAVNGSPGTGLSTDKEWLAVDNFAGAGQGNAYLIVRDFGAANNMRLYRSTDDGVTWGPNGGSVVVTGLSNQGGQVVVGPDHSVYVFWFENSGGQRLMARRSTDFGATFSAPVTITTLSTTGVNGDLGLPGGFRTSAFCQVAVHPVTGNVYVTYPDNPAGADRADIFFTQSTNLGATWSSPVRVNTDSTLNDQWQPGISVTPDGKFVYIGWYDRRLDPSNNLIDNFGRIGAINGSTVTFGADFRITTQSYGVVVGVDPVINTVYMGDYDQPSSNNDFFYYSWADNRDNSLARAGKQANVRLANITTDPFIVDNIPNGPVAAASSVVLNFNQPMDTTSFAVASDVVSFTGPSGSLLAAISGFTWNAAGTQLTINFTNQTTVGNYSMVLAPSIQNLVTSGGISLDNNLNGTPGEVPGDNYTASFSIALLLDYGDAPDTYGTLLASNGARHGPTGPTIGANRDAEFDAGSPLNGSGDDVTGTPDDEDGVTFGIITPGGARPVTVNVQGSAGFLNAWVDLDNNGTFDVGEQIAINLFIPVGSTTIEFTVPGGTPLGAHFARFRLTSSIVASPSPVGQLPDGEVEDHIFLVGTGLINENFDGVPTPLLPAGWTSVSGTGSNAWSTTSSTPFSAPNAAFIPNPGTITDTSLVSPQFVYQAGNLLYFRNFFNTENTFDGGVLEISLNGGAFTDVITAGGSFIAGGYNGTLSSSFGNPLGGRSAWTGNAGSYIVTAVSLPASGIGQVAQMRWRLGTDDSVSATGWRIDDVFLATMDYGDAPDTFGTLLASNGPRHTATGVRLGAARDPEPDANTPLNGTGDDATGVPDDEDGVTFGLLFPGGTGTATVNVQNGSGFLNAWIDINGNGTFEAGEQIATNLPVATGNTVVTFAIPANATIGTHYSRWRITSASVASPSPLGELPDGEVEDYPTQFTTGTINENFDLVSAPNLPSGWFSQQISGTANAWTTTTVTPFSAPNDAFIPVLATASDVALVSPLFTYNASNDRLQFRNFYNITDSGFDFASLEISINGGAFTNIVTAGGVFTSGAPNGTNNRWTGNSGGYILSKVILPASGYNQVIQVRWRMTSDTVIGAVAWRIDDVMLVPPPTLDFGDAPDTFGTLLASNGARHTGVGVRLGAARDLEDDAATPLNGTGDDVTQTDDEDGVIFGLLVPGQNGTATVNVQNGSGFLNAWLDFNGNGTFEAGEQIATNLAVAAGNNVITFAIPAGSTLGTHYSRFRLTSASVGSPSPVGLLPDGEVEDHIAFFTTGVINENFDGVSAPALPPAWATASAAGAIAWTTSTTTPFSAPNAAFIPNPATVTDTSLLSPTFTYAAGNYLYFRNNFALENTFDGGVLEISINGGPFTDVITAGGTFAAGGYNGTISSSFGNPLGGRQAWTGTAGSYLLSALVMPAAGAGQVAQLRWRLGTDNSVSATGWRVDNVFLATMDYGDAPDTFGTLLASNGARHTATGVRLGAARDPEPDANTPLNGTGDDVTLTPDDEDGVTFPLLMIPGQNVTATVNVQNGTGFLNAWIDFNQNGVFEAGEQIATNLAVGAGNNSVNFAIPGGTPLGVHHTRWRITSASVASPSPVGLLPDGEVEDHAITFYSGTLNENFDGVTAPALPVNWLSQQISGTANAWVTSTVTPFSAPNDAFIPNLATSSSVGLLSPLFTYSAANNLMFFRNFYNTESGFDFAELEVSFNGGAFTNIVTAGGVFTTGGPNASANRWSGNSGGYLLSGVILPAANFGQVTQLRWKLTSDTTTAAPGWRIDNVLLASVNVTLVGGNLLFNDPAARDDTLTVSRVGANIRFFDPNNFIGAGAGATQVDLNTVDVPFASVTGTFQINTQGGNDKVSLLLSGGILPASGVSYDGGLGSDSLSIRGTGVETSTYTPSATTPGSGTVAVAGKNVTFSNMEPLDLSSMLSAVVSLPGAADVVSIANGFDSILGTTPALLVSGTSGGVAFEPVALYNNTTATIDTTSSDGADAVTIVSANNAHANTNLIITTGTGNDLVTVSGAALTAGDFKVFSTSIVVNAAVTSTAGNVALIANDSGGSADNVTVNAPIAVTGGAGTIGLGADDNIVQTSSLTVGGSGDIVAFADDGAITMSAAATTTASGGNIGYGAGLSIALGSLVTTGNVILISDTAGITDANGAATNVSAANLAILAALGAGSADALETAVAGLASSTGGDLGISNAGTLTVQSVNASATTAELGLGLLIDGVTSGAGASLASTAGITIGDGGGQDITAATNVTLTSAGAITQGANSVISAAGLRLLGSGSATLNGANNVAALAANFSGPISYTDVDSFAAGSVLGTNGISAGANTVTLVSGGAITDGNVTGADVTAASLSMTAVSGIGVGDALDTAVSNIEAETGTGGLFVSNTGALAVGGVSALQGFRVTGASGNVSLVNAGTISITTNGDTVRGPADVTVQANGAAADVVTGGSTSLNVIRSTVSGQVTVQAGRDVIAGTSAGFGDIVSNNGGLSISAGRDFIADKDSRIRVDNGTQPLSISAGRNISLLSVLGAGARITATGGDVSLTAGIGGTVTLDSGAGGQVTNSGKVTITADDMVINSPVNGSVVTLKQLTAGRNVDLGSETAGKLSLTDAELDKVFTGMLNIGDANTGGIAISATLTQPDKNINLTTTGLSGTGDLINGSATQTTLTINQSGNSTYGGSLGGPAGGTVNDKNLAVVKAGPGALTLSAANSFAGPTTISAGTLLVNGSTNSSTTVAVGATLGGTGTVNGLVMVNGTVAPGTSPGKLATGATAFNAGSTYSVEIAGLNPGTGYDQLNVTGNVNLTGATLQLSGPFNPPGNTVLVIMTYTGTRTGTFVGLPNGSIISNGPKDYIVQYDDANKRVILISVVSVAPVVVDDGNRQRSMVRSVTLTFDTNITGQVAAVLAQLKLVRASDNLMVGLTATLDATGFILTLKFTGPSIIGGSLADGRYTLTFNNRVLLASSMFHRLFGDLDGDARVSTNANPPGMGGINEEAAMAIIPNGAKKGFSTLYNQYLDYNTNSIISTDDRDQFMLRLGRSI